MLTYSHSLKLDLKATIYLNLIATLYYLGVQRLYTCVNQHNIIIYHKIMCVLFKHIPCFDSFVLIKMCFICEICLCSNSLFGFMQCIQYLIYLHFTTCRSRSIINVTNMSLYTEVKNLYL